MNKQMYFFSFKIDVEIFFNVKYSLETRRNKNKSVVDFFNNVT